MAPLAIAGKQLRLRGSGTALLALVVACAVGALSSVSIIAALAAAVVASSVAVAAAVPVRTRAFAWRALLLLLCGYLVLGRIAAYVGVPPIFVGEIVLSLCLLAFLVGGDAAALLRRPGAWAISAFIGWGLVCTFPYVSRYGLASLRDAVTYGYAVFAVLVLWFLSAPGAIDGMLHAYRRALPWCVPAIAVLCVIFHLAPERFPNVPGSAETLGVKPGDVAVHLAGACAFLLAFAGRAEVRAHSVSDSWRAFVFWPSVAAGLLLSASSSRGGMLAFTVAIGVVLTLRPKRARAGGRGIVLFPTIVLALAFLLLSPTLNRFERREGSLNQVVLNVKSILGDAGTDEMQGTKSWRLDWWREIIGYAVIGEHRWRGKGYGVNLAESDGFVVDKENALRSPHSVHMTFLARGGIPGLALWLVVLGTTALALLRAHRRSATDDARRAAIAVVAAYWVAMIVNASFDVYLEGPTAGIWFWCLTGLALALADNHADTSSGSTSRAAGTAGVDHLALAPT